MVNIFIIFLLNRSFEISIDSLVVSEVWKYKTHWVCLYVCVCVWWFVCVWELTNEFGRVRDCLKPYIVVADFDHRRTVSSDYCCFGSHRHHRRHHWDRYICFEMDLHLHHLHSASLVPDRTFDLDSEGRKEGRKEGRRKLEVRSKIVGFFVF